MMKYVLGSMVCVACLPLVIFAQIESCGDGNQRYSQEKNGDVVRYFASVDDFKITRVSENKVIVEDKVDCRYGKDTLLNIKTVTFLDRSMSLQELVVHNQQKNLSLAILRSLLYDKVAQQVSSRGVNPFAETSKSQVQTTKETEVKISRDTDYNYSNSGRFMSNTDSLSSSFTPGQYSRQQNTAYQAQVNPYTSSSYYTPSSNQAYGNPYSGYNTSYQPQYNTTYVSPYAPSYPSYTPNAYGTGVPNASVGRVEINWNQVEVSPNEIIYFEATANGNEHHYLGSAVGYQARKVLDIPSFLGQEEQLTIYVKSGSRLIKTIEVEL